MDHKINLRNLIIRALLITVSLLLFTGCRIAGRTPEIELVGQSWPQEGADGINEITQAVQEATRPGTAPSIPAEAIVCEVKGHVALPGVYDLTSENRVADLIVRAGGVLPSGSLDFVNQARKLADGEVVVVPMKGTTKEEYDAMTVSGFPDLPVTMPGVSSQGTTQALVNINTATEAELDTIPGVGPATARNIIAYRTSVGFFTVIEDLKKVDRIGEKTFEKLKSFITVDP